MDSRARNLYCQSCDDFIYDHELERLRSPAPNVSLKGSSRSLFGLFVSATDIQLVSKRKATENSADELFIRSNASKRPCSRQGVRGLWNLGQSCFMNVILQALLHDPILHTHFLGNGHQTQECTVPDCVGCSVAEAFTEFNTTDKPESFVILNLLAATWRGSDVSTLFRYFFFLRFTILTLFRHWPDIVNKTHMNSTSSLSTNCMQQMANMWTTTNARVFSTKHFMADCGAP